MSVITLGGITGGAAGCGHLTWSLGASGGLLTFFWKYIQNEFLCFSLVIQRWQNNSENQLRQCINGFFNPSPTMKKNLKMMSAENCPCM